MKEIKRLDTATGPIARRIVALMNKEEIEYINHLAVDAYFSTGKRLTKVDIVAALVDAAMQLEITGIDVKSRQDLTQKIFQAVANNIERRAYPRIKKSFSVNFRVLDSMKEYNASKTIDVNLGGISIEINPELIPEIDRALEIMIIDGQGKRVKAIGKLCWIRKEEGSEKMKAGIKLTYISKDDWETFKQYLDE